MKKEAFKQAQINAASDKLKDTPALIKQSFLLGLGVLIDVTWQAAEAQFSEVGEMANDARTGHTYNILFDDGNAQAIGTKLYAKSEA